MYKIIGGMIMMNDEDFLTWEESTELKFKEMIDNIQTLEDYENVEMSMSSLDTCDVYDDEREFKLMRRRLKIKLAKKYKKLIL